MICILSNHLWSKSPDLLYKMKNKKLTYLLILVAVVIWGGIIRRLVTYTETGNVPPTQPVVRNDFPKEPPKYVPVLDYRDPFLEEKMVRKQLVPQGTAPAVSSNPEPPPERPPIRFKGVIRQGEKQYAILEIEKNIEILRRGETIEEFKLSTISSDSVILKKGKHTFTLKPQ